MADGKAPPIVVFGDDWGRHVSTMQHVFRHIVDRRPVLWVNAIGHRVPQFTSADLRRVWEKARHISRRGERNSSAAEVEQGPLPTAIIAPKVLPWHHRSAVHALNNWSLNRAIRARLASHGLTQPPILVTGSPPSVGVVGALGERLSVYFCMDDFLHLPGVTASMIGPLEQRLLAKVDAVVATAQALVSRKRSASGRGYYLPQGVNYEHFATPQPLPPQLQALPRPIAGFAGGIGAACDFPTLRAIADHPAIGSLALVGPVHTDVSALSHPKIHLLGPQPYQQLPAMVQHFDVALIPYVDNPWTQAVDPLKLLEYLAAGAPVVTSPLPEVAKYGEVVTIAPLGQPFAEAVATVAMTTPNPLPGRAVAQANTWRRRADRLLEILDELMVAVPAPRGVR